jgi:hypothetical protein
MHLESFRAARWVRTSNLVLQAILFVTLMAGLNYLSLYYAARFDITKLHRRSLSAETLSYLAQLNKPVRIFVTFDEHSQDDKYTQAFVDLAPLLGEYVYATEGQKEYKRISWAPLDVYQRPREAQILKAEQNEILIVCDGRIRILHYDDLYQFKDGKRAGFLGEQAITSAILEVAMTANKKKIYFVAGHGELEANDVSADHGISEFTDQLSQRNLELDRLVLREVRKIPDDASMLIIARPTTAFEPYEEELLRQYLTTRAGRLLVFLSPGYDIGLSDLFWDWGILADHATIYDSGPAGQNDTGALVFNRFAPHAITQPLLDQKLVVAFGATRSVRHNPSRAADEGLTVTRLIGAADTAWGEMNPRQDPPRYDTGVDLIGRVLGAAVASERVGAKKELNFSVPRGRVVVFGSDFITNNRISAGGNLQLALSSVNWLVDRDTQLNIAARPIENFQLALSAQQLLRLRYCLLFVLPGAVALLGVVVYWTRRR